MPSKVWDEITYPFARVKANYVQFASLLWDLFQTWDNRISETPFTITDTWNVVDQYWCDITWASLCFKLPATWLLVQQLVQLIKRRNQSPIICEEKPPVTGGFPSQRMQKSFYTMMKNFESIGRLKVTTQTSVWLTHTLTSTYNFQGYLA